MVRFTKVVDSVGPPRNMWNDTTLLYLTSLLSVCSPPISPISGFRFSVSRMDSFRLTSIITFSLLRRPPAAMNVDLALDVPGAPTKVLYLRTDASYSAFPKEPLRVYTRRGGLDSSEANVDDEWAHAWERQELHPPTTLTEHGRMQLPTFVSFPRHLDLRKKTSISGGAEHDPFPARWSGRNKNNSRPWTTVIQERHQTWTQLAVGDGDERGNGSTSAPCMTYSLLEFPNVDQEAITRVRYRVRIGYVNTSDGMGPIIWDPTQVSCLCYSARFRSI